MRWGLLTSARTFAPEDGGSSDAAPEIAPAPVENAGQDGSGKSETQADEHVGEETSSGETTEQPDPKPKKNADRRFAALTAKSAAQRAELATAIRERDAALALANAGKDPQPTTQTDIETAARRLVADREAKTKLSAVVTKGQEEYPDWGPKTTVLADLGATENAAFMEALVEMPNATKIVAHLSDDVEALEALLGKSPTAMAAAMGRLDAELGRAPVKALSKAPAPVRPIASAAVLAEPNIYDDNMSMADYVKARNKVAPRNLGGRR